MDIWGKWVNSIKITMLILAITLSSVGFAAAQVTTEPDCPTEEACELWEEFKEKYGTNWLIKWHEYIDAPRLLEGYYYLGRNITNKDDAEIVSRTFIENNKDFLKIDVSELKLSRVYEDWNSFDPEYQQYYKGVPVEQGRVRTIVYKDDSIGYLSNHFYPNISISTTPKITEDEAISIAKDYFTTRNPGVEASLVILPSDYIELGKVEKSDTLRYYLAWKVKFHEKTIYVDAENGDVLFEYENLRIEIDEGVVEDVNKSSEVNISGPENESYNKSLQTDTNLIQKPEINKSAPQETPLFTGKRIAIFGVILVAVLSAVLFLKRGGKS